MFAFQNMINKYIPNTPTPPHARGGGGVFGVCVSGWWVGGIWGMCLDNFKHTKQCFHIFPKSTKVNSNVSIGYNLIIPEIINISPTSRRNPKIIILM
jgi:hypothetical protein